MTLLVILAVVFGSVAIMVILGEKYGKPMEAQEQQKYSKWLIILVFIMLFAALINQLI
ncbi:hypothetical protein RGQ13_14065 [Thalassotalea psychrophila]|uniref:HIG1 domain-containing protein n=1 Tax=Thalassotalea psychrophila TaxID=3065647 RepID=A0ABY9TQY5_9GAMM|nr:hypothetical protein RGQ13_14065 [Colwelliaceae bacterium SQ149]